MIRFILAFLYIIFTCNIVFGQNSNYDTVNIIKLNDVLFQDINSKVFYYNYYHYYSGKSKDIVILESISCAENDSIKDIDVNSFRDMGVYWIDDNYIYYIYR